MANPKDFNDAYRRICDRLTDRAATLFLGAGVNAGLFARDDASLGMPLGPNLAALICRDLLNASDLMLSLDEAAEIARHRVGPKEVNRYIYDLLTRFSPGEAHEAIAQLPWDLIYTTNYDLLLETAANTGAGFQIRPVFSTSTDLSQFSESDILYYKIHGSIDQANSENGRLILTKNDYRFYESHRKPLFRRLRSDLLSRAFLFVGYSLADSNFREILEDCREELGTASLPLSYAVRPTFSAVEEAFWREKYNIQLIAGDGSAFLTGLRDTWKGGGFSVVPLDARRATAYLKVDESTLFPKVGDSFYHILPDRCGGSPRPDLFFRGAEPTWADIREHVPPKRDAYWAILDSIFPDFVDPSLRCSLYLLTGAAGTGKTTLLRTLAFDLANEFSLPVLVHISDTPLDARRIGSLVNPDDPKRVVVLIHHAADVIDSIARFMQDAALLNYPVTVILEERKNQWQVAATNSRFRSHPAEVELTTLSDDEVDSILDALAKHGALGKLTAASRQTQRDHFMALADKELLVALRELTSEGSFDDIVRDEFQKIPSEVAKQAYVYVAMISQLEVSTRYEVLVRLLGLRYDQLGSDLFKPTEGILISGEASGSSRYTAGFVLRARHPIIASIIYAAAAPDDTTKFHLLNSLLAHLDPGFPEDKRVLDAIYKVKTLIHTFASPENRRAVFDRIESILPGNPYVLQHRSILERELGDPDLALKYAREAYSSARTDVTIANTMGLALEFAARASSDPIRVQAFLSEADKIFDDNLRVDRTNPYGYIGKTNVLRQRLEREVDRERKAILKSELLSLIEEAYENTSESPIIASQLASQRGAVGDVEEAIKIANDGLVKNPADERLRALLVQLEHGRGNREAALSIAIEGVKLNPTSWRLQRWVARLRREAGAPVEAVRGYYDAAVRLNKGNIELVIELAAYLFTHGFYDDASVIFRDASALPVPGQEKSLIRDHWRDGNGAPKTFEGMIKQPAGAVAGIVAIPENFVALFWRTQNKLLQLREGDKVRFRVGFSARGPNATNIEPIK